MSNDEVTSRIQTILASKRGSELIDAIGLELGDVHSQIDRLSKQVLRLQAFHAFSERMSILSQASVSPTQLPHSLCIDAAQLFEPGNGFYQLEYERNGQPFRWTGPGRDFSFSLFIDRTASLQVRLEVAYMMDPTRQNDLVVLVDGELLACTLTRQTGCWIGEVIVPALPASQATNLVFVVPCVIKPDSNNDTRTLGVAFRKLAITPCADVKANAEICPTLHVSPQHALLAKAKSFSSENATGGEIQEYPELKLVRALTPAQLDQPSMGDDPPPVAATAARS
jgi:hypothetical protein